MSETLTISIIQMNPTVGAIAHNCQLIAAAYARAATAGADLVVTPELSVIGYPPEDLVLKPALQREAMDAVATLTDLTAVKGAPGLIVGSCWLEGGDLYNASLLLEGGAIKETRFKHELPNYGVFDEKRLFKAAPNPATPMNFRGVKLGVMICEDMWFERAAKSLKAAKADILLVPTCSPYEQEKQQSRLQYSRARTQETGLPIIFANQVGGQDELVFDGASFVLDAAGIVQVQMADWRSCEQVTQWAKQADGSWACDSADHAPQLSGLAEVYQAMVLGLRDYVDKNHFPGVLIGLSGGVDSALTAAVAVDALGPERVDCVMMPSKFTTGESLSDADQCAAALGVPYTSIAIKPGVAAFDAMLGEAFKGSAEDATEENIQSRLRGMILMALSNKFGRMVLTTGNKSEMSVGYATLYGDMCGGYSVLKDVYKTMVFELCRWRNKTMPLDGMGKQGEVIPHNIIVKPPTAELKEDQRDDDSLPPYDALDDMLICLVDKEMSAEQIVARGHSKQDVARIERLLYIAEYKRRQSPPGVKITQRNFGRDRRYPITNGFRSARPNDGK